jgi:transcriptional regulator with XRE-family HTH domain
LTQTKFGATLGVSRDSINNYELGRVIPSDLFINYLCKTYGVDETWLRTGSGEMLIRSKKTILDELVTAHNLNDQEATIIKVFLDLSPAGRAGVLEYVNKLVDELNGSSEREQVKPVHIIPVAARNGEGGEVSLTEEEEAAAQRYIKENYPELEK